MSLPTRPKIYHILHVDRLASVLDDGVLWSDALVRERRVGGTTIGMGNIKRRRLEQNSLASHPGLRVGDCVPFYFCPRSIMLHLIWRANHPELTYRGGQEPIIHLEADLEAAVAWAGENHRRWAFTLSNAGSAYFEDRARLGSTGGSELGGGSGAKVVRPRHRPGAEGGEAGRVSRGAAFSMAPGRTDRGLPPKRVPAGCRAAGRPESSSRAGNSPGLVLLRATPP